MRPSVALGPVALSISPLGRSPLAQIMSLADDFESFKRDLDNDDWDYYAGSNNAWQKSPSFYTCLITAASVQQAAALGLFPLLGLGPLLVLLSSVVHWWDPKRESWRRTLDVVTVRIGMSSQVLIACYLCASGHLPVAGVASIVGGYAAALPCYAIGRVLTVRGLGLQGAFVHGGLHLFSNLGNLLMLRLVSS